MSKNSIGDMGKEIVVDDVKDAGDAVADGVDDARTDETQHKQWRIN